jgi:hypothetical protein
MSATFLNIHINSVTCCQGFLKSKLLIFYNYEVLNIMVYPTNLMKEEEELKKMKKMKKK